MPRSIEDVFDLIEVESRYASWDRLVLLGAIMLIFAVCLGLLWLTLLPFHLLDSWIFLLLPSLILGFWGLMQYAYGKDKITDVNNEIKAFREESKLAGSGETPINDKPINKL